MCAPQFTYGQRTNLWSWVSLSTSTSDLGCWVAEQAPLPAEFSHRTLEFYFDVSCYFLCLGFTIPPLEDSLFFPIRLEKYIPPAYSIPVYTLTRTNKGQQFSHHRIVISCITQG